MAKRDFSGEEVYKVLVNVGGFTHVRTTGDHLILRWEPPEDHETTTPRVVSVPSHESISIGTLRDIARDAGTRDFDAFCEWIDRNS
ncbi:MAG: type II toxin-antitoxin system HicA family toxin [Halobaculum sp.]